MIFIFRYIKAANFFKLIIPKHYFAGLKITTKAANSLKELVIGIIGIVIPIILAVFALRVSSWALELFNITNEIARAAGLIAVAMVIGPSIAAFTTKKYY